MSVPRDCIGRSWRAGFVVALVVAGGASAAAQAIDRGPLEQLFGEPLTTSATGKPQRASTVPANMEIITAADIRRSGADNIPDILRYVAGIDVRRYAFAAADVGVRGYTETSNPRLLVLVNGQQVYLDDLGRTQWYTLPVEMEEIRQIEVVKGPNTALFGFNAASGVINIITYDPLHDRVNVATARAGTQGYTALSVVQTGKIGTDGGLRIAADGFRAREFDAQTVIPEDQAFQRSPERGAVSADGRYRVNAEVEVDASAAAVDTRTWEATASPYFGTDYQRTNFSRLGVSADTAAGVFGLNVYRNELRYSYAGASEIEDLHDTVYVAEASDLLKLDAGDTLRLGLDYRDNAATSSRVLAGRIGYTVISASAMWDWQINGRLSWTNAARFDHFSLDQRGYLVPGVGFPASRYRGRAINQPSFNSGLVWQANEATTLRLTAARGLQLPSIYDLGLQDREPPGPDGQAYLYLGNPDVRASTVDNVELGADRSWAWLRSTLRAAVFVQRTTDILTNPYETDVAPDGVIAASGLPELRAVAQNVGSSTAAGGELGLRGTTRDGADGAVRWNASYSYISIADDLTINQTGLYSPQDFQRNTPAHVVVLGGGVTRGKWEADVRGRWQSRFLDFRADANTVTLMPVWIGNYVVMDARLAYQVTPSLTLAVTSDQFNVSHLTQSAGPPIERRILVSATARF